MVRSFLAVLSGYASMAIVVMALTPLAARLFIPEGAVAGAPYLSANIAYSFAAAVLGGWVAARLAPRNPLAHGAALAGTILILSLTMLQAGSQSGGPQPSWYPLATLVIGVAGSLIGAWWRARQQTP
jgi:hypothetical protein